jgi:hypothetical protein
MRRHTPAWQVSVWVHGLPSSHPVPSTFGKFGSQTPVGAPHVPWTSH